MTFASLRDSACGESGPTEWIPPGTHPKQESVDDACWFLAAVMLSVGGWLLGLRAGARGDATTHCCAAAGLLLLLAWTWVLKNPSAGVRVLPVRLLARAEGVGSLPMFALVLGVCWQRARCLRQKAVVGAAVAAGLASLLNGGGWMLQRTPEAAFAQAPMPAGSAGLVFQSQDFSCVPAACSTLLHRWGVRASEAEMARLTRTRAGTGSTTLRALEGLATRLAATDLRPVLLEVGVEELSRLPLPLITPLRHQPGQLHMVTVERALGDGFVVLDPVDGAHWLSARALAEDFTGRVIVLEPRR